MTDLAQCCSFKRSPALCDEVREVFLEIYLTCCQESPDHEHRVNKKTDTLIISLDLVHELFLTV